MGGLLQIIGDWGHIAGAGLFAALAIWISRRFATQIAGKLLVAALSLTSIWLLSIAFGGVDRLETGVMESLRNCGWLVCLYVLPAQLGGILSRQTKGALPLYAVLGLLLIAQSGLDILATLAPSKGDLIVAIGNGAVVLRMLWAIGALILIQRIYTACVPQVRAVVAPVVAAMVAMWSYDLILYGAAFLDAQGVMTLLYALRGGVIAVLAPVIALVGHTGRNAVVRPSRLLAWRGLSMAAGFFAILLLLSVLLVLDRISDPSARAAVTGALFLIIAGGLLLTPVSRFHRTMKVLVAKHLFTHRYDYREQWMAFADTIGQAGQDGAGIHQRLVKAMADITQSSAGALLMSAGEGRFLWQCGWNWKYERADELVLDVGLAERMRVNSWIVDLGQARASHSPGVSEWLLQEQAAWAIVPLIHFDELIGVALLSRPPVMRALDWEDFDMLRAAGRQVASYIAEARGQQALEEARRFEEFNRRFAFVMHDIKNLVSQLALVARNAERHAGNPEFRADMILTLKDSTDKMNRLLARLSQQGAESDATAIRFAVGDAIRSVIAARGAIHPLLAEGDLAMPVEADRNSVEQILGHLVQNAIEASVQTGSPVIIRAGRSGNEVRISVIDHGCGMTAEFVRDELFRPFASSKQGGFGIGAYEALTLAQSMGGRLDVESAPGKGACFTLGLPLAGRNMVPSPENTGKAA